MRSVAMFRITTSCSLVCSYQCFGSYCFLWGTTRTRRQEVLSRTTLPLRRRLPDGSSQPWMPQI
jgi:hypothetical protein